MRCWPPRPKSGVAATAEPLAVVVVHEMILDVDRDRQRSDPIFPVVGDCSFVGTFLAARMAGTSDGHRHWGIDIFGPQGTSVVAVERGAVMKIR